LEKRLLRERAVAQVGRLKGQSDPHQWAHLAAGWKELGFRYDEASARFHHAEALLGGTAGRTASARRAASAELMAACTTAQELRATPLLHKITRLAQRARLPIDADDAPARPDDGAPGNRFGLTSRELDVLDLLAQGRSNGQIGEALFISTKTASVHVSNILRKLGVSNRVEASAFAAGRVTSS
jgi:DNA-binding CsgD family transcriptional regulator